MADMTEHAHLVLTNFNTPNEALDLGSSLLGISGVGHVDVDPLGHTVSVDYDRAYLSEVNLRAIITGSGYLIEGDETGQ